MKLHQHTPTPTPPCMTLQDKIDEMDISIADFSQLSGLDESTINSILSNEIKIDYDIANCLKLATEIPSYFWINLQMNYDSAIADKPIGIMEFLSGTFGVTL